jgi:hypothetical protein
LLYLSTIELSYYDIETARDLEANIEFSTGIHTWEIIFPVGILRVEFGVKSVKSLKKFFRKFKTTTPRFVAVTLDVDARKLTYRLNRDPFTDKVIMIDGEGPFVPFVSAIKPEISVIMNPYPRLLDHQKVLVSAFR